MKLTEPSNIENGVRDSQGGIYEGDKLLKFSNANIRKYQVKEGTKIICDGAFRNSDIEWIVLPDSVEEIGEGAFEGASKLRSVNIPEGVTEIRRHTFSGCDSLQKLVLPNTLLSIDSDSLPSGIKMLELHSLIPYNELVFEPIALRQLIVPPMALSHYKNLKSRLGLSFSVIPLSDPDEDCDQEEDEEDCEIEESVEETRSDETVADVNSDSFVNITVLSLYHTRSELNDDRLLPKSVLTLKSVPNSGKTKAFVIKGHTVDVLIEKINKYIQLNIGVQMDIFQVVNFESNIPEISNLNNDEKEDYAFSLIKLYKNALLARQLDPVVELKVNLEVQFTNKTEYVGFNLIKGKVKDLTTKTTRVHKTGQEEKTSEISTNSSSTAGANRKPIQRKVHRTTNYGSKPMSFLDTLKAMIQSVKDVFSGLK